MSLSPSQIFLYGATTTDYANAHHIANAYGIPYGNVTGSFAMAWAAVASGKFLVIAVGGPANNALYYNQCGWAGAAAGSTPFYILSNAPVNTIPAANYYESAAGNTGTDSYNLAVDYVEYALGKAMSYSLPAVVGPSQTCGGSNPIYGV